jgi:hypothetical protein
MQYRELIAVSSEIHTKHTNMVCGQMVGFFNVRHVVHEVIIGLYSVNYVISQFP